jgi:hypothetical protein
MTHSVVFTATASRQLEAIQRHIASAALGPDGPAIG